MDAAVKVVALAVALELDSATPFSLSSVDISGIKVRERAPFCLRSFESSQYIYSRVCGRV